MEGSSRGLCWGRGDKAGVRSGLWRTAAGHVLSREFRNKRPVSDAARTRIVLRANDHRAPLSCPLSPNDSRKKRAITHHPVRESVGGEGGVRGPALRMKSPTIFRAQVARPSFAAKSSTAAERGTLGPSLSMTVFGFGSALREPPHPIPGLIKILRNCPFPVVRKRKICCAIVGCS